MSLFIELKRRNVFRVGIAYVLMGWLALQGADFLLDLAGAPDWVVRTLAVLVVIGLPFALFFAWAFELTPEGIRREKDVDRSTSITRKTGRKLDFAIIGFLVLVIALLIGERVFFAERAVSTGESAATSAAGEAGGAKTIAVLPFADMSQAQDQGWFADGLAEEILNTLTRAPDLLVASRTSSFRYKNSDLDITDIAAALGVAHVLEGSVRSSGNRIRVTAQLIRASDGFHVWSQNYDRGEEDMIAIQEDLARSIATALQTSMDPEALAAMSQAGTRSVAAYKAYLEGLALEREAGNKTDREKFLAALTQFELATSHDPLFAAAHLQQANWWKSQLDPTSLFGGATGLASADKLQRFAAAINAAIENAPNETDRRGYEAQRAEVDLRLRDAMRLYRAYLEQRPNDDAAWSGLIGVAQMAFDKPLVDEVLAHFRERGRQESDQALAYLGSSYQYRPFDETTDYALSTARRWPNYPGLLYQAHRVLMWTGRAEDGALLAQRYAEVVAEENLVAVRQACIEGRRDVAERFLAKLGRATDGGVHVRQWLVLKMLGRDQEALQVLQDFASQRSTYEMAYFLTYRIFDPRPFPDLMAVLEREGVEVPQPLELPYRCPAAIAAEGPGN